MSYFLCLLLKVNISNLIKERKDPKYSHIPSPFSLSPPLKHPYPLATTPHQSPITHHHLPSHAAPYLTGCQVPTTPMGEPSSSPPPPMIAPLLSSPQLHPQTPPTCLFCQIWEEEVLGQTPDLGGAPNLCRASLSTICYRLRN